METKKQSKFIFGLIAVIIGVALYKDINFMEMTLRKPALDAVYAVTLAFVGFAMLRKKVTQTENENESGK